MLIYDTYAKGREGTYEDTGTAGRGRALATKTLDLAVALDLVVLEDGHLNLLALVLDLLGRVVRLLFALLGATAEAKHYQPHQYYFSNVKYMKERTEVKGRLLLDVVVAEGAAVLKLLAGEDQALLVGRDALLVLDLGLHIVDRVGRLHLEGDGLAREGLDEDLHL